MAAAIASGVSGIVGSGLSFGSDLMNRNVNERQQRVQNDNWTNVYRNITLPGYQNENRRADQDQALRVKQVEQNLIIERERNETTLGGMRLQGQNQRDTANIQGATSRDVVTLQSAGQSQLQQQQFAQQNLLRQNTIQSLKAAGLPEYLADVSFNPSMLESVKGRGVNFRTRFRGGTSFF